MHEPAFACDQALFLYFTHGRWEVGTKIRSSRSRAKSAAGEAYICVYDDARLPDEVSSNSWQVNAPPTSSSRKWSWTVAPSVRCLRYDEGAAGKPGQLSLHWACEVGSAESVGALLAQGADPDRAEKDARGGSTLSPPLAVACLYGHTACARQLLDAKATIDLPGREGTPLIAAARRCQVECVALLLERSASLSERVNGKTALDFAASLDDLSSPDSSRWV
jgi:hypothetical protein